MSKRINKAINMRQSYNGLSDMIDYIQKDFDTKKYTLLEIGAYAGESTVYFANFFHTVITIDPFISDYDKNDPTCKYMKLENVYDLFLKNIDQHSNIIHIKDTSDRAIDYINKYTTNLPPILVVYIDGLHTFDQVLKDIFNYKTLIAKNGYLCGHDYHPKAWPGVCDAINSYQKPDCVFTDTSWLIRAPDHA